MMSPEDFTQLLHDRLDDAEIPERPWSMVKSRLTSRRHRRWVNAAAGLTVCLAVVGIIVGLAVALPSQGSGSGHGRSPAAHVSSQSTLAGGRSAPIPARLRVTAGMAAQPGFLVFVAGSSLSGPVLSSTQIAARDANWSASRADAIVDASPAGQAYWSPSLSPSRTKVVYVGGSASQVGTNSGQGDLVIANINGTDQHTVTTGNQDTDPVWSPNGHNIAFLRDGAIWEMSADGAKPHAVSSLTSVHTIAWAPNGTELAAGTGDPVRIALVNVAHQSFKWFTPAGHIEQYNPSWSPNGKFLVYGQTGPNALFISNLKHTKVRQLTICKSTCSQDVEPIWSPNGSEIAFVRSLNGNVQVYVVPASGGKIHRLTGGKDQHMLPSW
jgi:hypothetical protein